MVQAYPQFTPAQILDAGQRAQAEGRAEQARQFYQHLVEHYGRSIEAAAARDALAQMGGQMAGNVPPTQPHGLSELRNGRDGAHHGLQHNANVQHGRNGAHHGEARPPLPQDSAPRGEPKRGVRDQLPLRIDGDDRRAIARQKVALPAPENNYLTGRVVAYLFIVSALLAMLAGVLLLVGANGGPDIVAMAGLPPVRSAVFAGPALIVAGLIIFLFGQMARAIFDGANAMRDVARVTRKAHGGS